MYKVIAVHKEDAYHGSVISPVGAIVKPTRAGFMDSPISFNLYGQWKTGHCEVVVPPRLSKTVFRGQELYFHAVRLERIEP